MLAEDMVLGRSRYLPLDGLGMMERYRVLRTMRVVVRGDGQE